MKTALVKLGGWMRHVPHRDSLARNAKSYEVIFSDVEGPMSVTGHEGSRFFVTFLDASTKESEVFLIKYKSEVPMFSRYKASKERPKEGRVIRLFHSDGEENILGSTFNLTSQRTGLPLPCYTPASQQQNGTSERLKLTFLKKAHAIMGGSELSKQYWPYMPITSETAVPSIP